MSEEAIAALYPTHHHSYHTCPISQWRKEHVLAWLNDTSQELSIDAGNLVGYVERSGTQLLSLTLPQFVELNPLHGEVFFNKLCSYVHLRSRQNGYHHHSQQQAQQQQHLQSGELVSTSAGATYHQLQPRSSHQYPQSSHQYPHQHWPDTHHSHPYSYYSEPSSGHPYGTPISPNPAALSHTPSYSLPPTSDPLSHHHHHHHHHHQPYSPSQAASQAAYSPSSKCSSYPTSPCLYSPTSTSAPCYPPEATYGASVEAYTHSEYKPALSYEDEVTSYMQHLQACSPPGLSPPSSLPHPHSADDQLCAGDTPKRIKNRGERGPKLWEFLLDLLEDPVCNPGIIRWENEEDHTFRLTSPHQVALRWGQRRPKENQLPYDYFARALRYHYRTGMLISVPERKLVYRFSPQVFQQRRGECGGGSREGAGTTCASPPTCTASPQPHHQYSPHGSIF